MSNGIKFDLDGFFRQLDRSSDKVRRGATRGMEDVIDDLARVSSAIAPHAEGILDSSYETKVKWDGDILVGELTYSVSEESGDGSRYNYALWTHESSYELGEESQLKPGTEGMSGKHYNVGNKYLERPLKGESGTYKEHIATEIRREMGT